MTRSILVGLDGSTYSIAAVELGIRWAKKFNATLVGLGVVDEPTILRPEPTPLGTGGFKENRDESRLVDACRKAEQFLQHFARRCGEAGVAYKLLKDVGLPSEQICLEAQRYDLILLGKQTFYHFETQCEPDETLTKVLKNSPRPVVTVPEQLHSGNAVVVAYDGSLQAARSLAAFQALQLDKSHEVHIVSVDVDQSVAIRNAEFAIGFLDFHAIKAQPHAIASSSPAATILEQVQRVDADLLVMGAYGQPRLKEFVFGSVTRSMLKESMVPLFLYH